MSSPTVIGQSAETLLARHSAAVLTSRYVPSASHVYCVPGSSSIAARSVSQYVDCCSSESSASGQSVIGPSQPSPLLPPSLSALLSPPSPSSPQAGRKLIEERASNESKLNRMRWPSWDWFADQTEPGLRGRGEKDTRENSGSRAVRSGRF